MSLNVFGDKPLTAFEESGGEGDDFVIAEHKGATVIVQVVGVVEKETRLYGVKPAIECASIVSIDKKGKATVYSDVLLFQAAPVSQLRKMPGQKVVATVIDYPTKQGGTAYKFDAPTPAMLAAAEAYEGANA